MIRGTTPTLTFNLPFATSTIQKLYISFADRDNNIVLEKTEADCTLSAKTILRPNPLFLYRNISRRAKPKESSYGGSRTHTSSSGRTHGGGGGKF